MTSQANNHVMSEIIKKQRLMSVLSFYVSKHMFNDHVAVNQSD